MEHRCILYWAGPAQRSRQSCYGGVTKRERIRSSEGAVMTGTPGSLRGSLSDCEKALIFQPTTLATVIFGARPYVSVLQTHSTGPN
jgi:hypothetical protein